MWLLPSGFGLGAVRDFFVVFSKGLDKRPREVFFTAPKPNPEPVLNN